MSCRATLVMVVALLMLSTLRAQDPRAPVPEPEVESKARKLVQDVYKELLAGRTPADRKAALEKLRKTLGKTKGTVERHALLREIHEIAVAAGDGATALGSIEELERAYRLSGGRMRIQTLETLERNARTPDEQRALAVLCLGAIDALAREDHALAVEGVKIGERLAEKARGKPLIAEVQARKAELRELTAYRDRAARAQTTLAANPEDPGANFEVGLFRCFLLGDWAAGLPFLAKGNDPRIKEIAAADLAEPAEPNARLEIADGWWDVGQSRTGGARTRILERAAARYRMAAPGLDGFGRERAETRIKEAAAATRRLEEPEPAEPATEGLVGRWDFDEEMGTEAADSSGKGNRGLLQNGVRWVKGVRGGALSFDGIDDYVKVGVSELPSIDGAMTVAWYQWVKANPEGPCNAIALCSWSQMASLQIGFRPGPGHIRIWKLSGDELLAAPAPSTQTWHHCAYTFDGTTHRIYVDGRKVSDSSVSQKAGVPDYLEFGRWNGKKKITFFTGILDEVRIYRRTLSEKEIRLLLRPSVR